MTDTQGGYGLEPAEEPQRRVRPAPNVPSEPEGSMTARVLAEQRAARRAALEADSAETARRAYLTPLLMLAVGAGFVSTVAAATGSLEDAGVYLASYAVSVPIGLLVFLACCAMWIGFDAPLGLTVLRLAGIYAVTDAANTVIGFIPYGGVLGWILVIGIYVGLLSELLELEIVDAAIVAVATFFARMAIVMAILFTLQ